MSTEDLLIIRPEEPRDYAAIRQVVHAAFLDHPHHEPGSPPAEHLIVEKLRASGALVISLVAEIDGAIVGHIAFSPVRIAARSAGWFALGPLAVAPACQGRGMGSAPVRRGMADLWELGADGILLVGEPDYYARFGFRVYEGLHMNGVPAR